MKINTQGAGYFTGLGDSITFAWLGAANPDLTFYATDTRAKLLTMLGQNVTDDPTDAISPSDGYRIELADNGRLPRLEYMRAFLKLETYYKRPTVSIDSTTLSFLPEQFLSLGERRILLCPQTHWQPREWLPTYWIDLAWKLKAAGYTVAMCLMQDDKRYAQAPHRFYGYNLNDVAWLMKNSQLVIGVDSMPCHFAGTIGVKTLALMGPTKPTVFSHISNVFCLQSKTFDCVGCHFAKPFRAACDQGCSSLFSLFPDAVLKTVLKLLA